MTPTAEGPAVNGPTERAALHEAVLWHDRCREAEARVAVLAQQIAAIEALHVEVEGDRYTGGGFCAECCDEWPCPTVLAAGVVDNPTEETP